MLAKKFAATAVLEKAKNLERILGNGNLLKEQED
jgi:hypothetical protein